ncbi:MAG: NAD(P)/FAD-dependent oxidoreductase [Pseudomonadota bacterium]
MKPEVLVVGAGPTGLTTAIELARRGVRTAIIEQREGVSTLSRAVGITPASLELLGASGASELLLREGIQIEHLRILFGGTQLLSTSFSLSTTRHHHPFILALSQERTERVLSRVLDSYGISIRYNTRLQSLNDTHDGALAVCSDGTAKLYRYVVGADGINSTTRESIGLAFTGQDLDEQWSIADVNVNDWNHKHTMTLSLLDNGAMAAMIPLDADRIRVIANTGAALDYIANMASVTHVHREGHFNVSVRQIATYQRGNVLVAGDAAHCHSPVGGRGMNLGFADAACVADCIANDKVSAYSAIRHPAGYRTINNSERARKLFSTRHRLGRFALQASLRIAGKSTLLQRRLIDQLLYA